MLWRVHRLLQQHKFGPEFQHVITEIRRQHEHTQYLRESCLLRLQITFRRYEGLMHNRLPQFTITTIISCAVSQVNSAREGLARDRSLYGTLLISLVIYASRSLQ